MLCHFDQRLSSPMLPAAILEQSAEASSAQECLVAKRTHATNPVVAVKSKQPGHRKRDSLWRCEGAFWSAREGPAYQRLPQNAASPHRPRIDIGMRDGGIEGRHLLS